MALGRKSGGRVKGSKNKKTLLLEAAAAAAIAGIPFEGGALQRLQVIYRDPKQPFDIRMRAMESALPYESPRLQAVEYSGGLDVRQTTTIDLSALSIDELRTLNGLVARAASKAAA